MVRPVVVINPNSNQSVTDGLEKSLISFNKFGGFSIECVTLAEGPFGIESQLDSDSVVIPLANIVKSRKDAAAFVIACYSDPGIDACRSITSQPVFGIQESGVLTALSRADLFGVIAIFLIFLIPILLLLLAFLGLKFYNSRIDTCSNCGAISFGLNQTCVNCGADLKNISETNKLDKNPSESTIEVKAEEVK